MRRAAALALPTLLAACGHPDGTAQLQNYTGIALCPSAKVSDLTTTEERATYPGFSYHVALTLDPACDTGFRQALARVSPQECPTRTLRRHGCTIRDLARQPGRHATMLVVPGSGGEYDVRIYG